MKNNYNKFYNEQRGNRANNAVDESAKTDLSSDKIKEALEKDTTTPPNEPKDFKVINCSNLNVRKKADRGSSVKAIIKAGQKVVVEEIVDDWAHIYTDSGVEGYVMKEFLEEV